MGIGVGASVGAAVGLELTGESVGFVNPVNLVVGVCAGKIDGECVGEIDGETVGARVCGGNAWEANAKTIGYCVTPSSGVTKQSGAPLQAFRAVAIA